MLNSAKMPTSAKIHFRKSSAGAAQDDAWTFAIFPCVSRPHGLYKRFDRQGFLQHDPIDRPHLYRILCCLRRENRADNPALSFGP
jgi:hypothetical protein